MRDKKLFLSVLLGSCIFFISFVSGFLLFKQWNILGLKDRPIENIIVEAAIVSILFCVFIYLFFKKRLNDKS
jgi:hypothetical protein